MVAVGMLQEPLARWQGTQFELAFGHCRVEAARRLHERGQWGPALKVKLTELSDEDMAYIALAENQASARI